MIFRRTMAALALMGLVLTGCSTLFPPARGEPFSEGPRRAVGHRYQVVLDVQCDRCLVSYTLGTETRSINTGRSGWHEVFYRTPLMPETIRLTARNEASDLTGGAQGTMRGLSISVDGDVVARDRCDETEMYSSCSLGAEAVIGS